MCILTGSEIMHPFYLYISSLIIGFLETPFQGNIFTQGNANKGDITKMRSKNVVPVCCAAFSEFFIKEGINPIRCLRQ